MDNLPKACVILGAGASHDVAGEGSPIINPDYRPPLSKDLFDIARNPLYDSILRTYPGATYLAQQLAPLINSGQQISIERELARYSQHHDALIRSHFKHVPPYLRDLIFLCCTKFVRIPSSYVQLIHVLLSEYPHNLLFITLNYDTLLETALNLYDSRFIFNHMIQYVDDSLPASVIKLHGSINWFYFLTKNPNKTWEQAVEDFDINKPLPPNQINIISFLQSCTHRYDKYWVYPIITAPLATKTISNLVCPHIHVQAAKEFLHSCSKFLIIGTSGLDNDLYQLLDSTLHPQAPRLNLIHIVDMGQLADSVRMRYAQNVSAFHGSINEVHTFKIGFKSYISSPHIESFAKFTP